MGGESADVPGVIQMESLEQHDARVKRMQEEAGVLQVRIKVASDFVEGVRFQRLSDLEQQLLVSQILTMQAYLGILNLRIDLATD